ncbi:flagellar biosynthesis anti-sigma factor FlgM [Desulfurobacterium sp.]
MKIEGFQNIPGVEAQQLKKQLQKRARNRGISKSELQNASTVSVGESADIEKAVKEQIQLQSVNEQRVEEIKEALNSGKYPIDIHKISESMLKDLLGL